MRRFGWVLLAPLLLVAAGPARADEAGAANEASREILRETLQSNKKALVDVNLALSDEEARAFWPVYDRYQTELGAVQDRMANLIESYAANFGKMTDAEAEKLTKDFLAIERDRARSYHQAYSALVGLHNLERALGQTGASTEAVLEGVRMTYDMFLAELRKFGLEQLSSEGEAFDPARHEAIGSVVWEGKPEGTVLSEAHKGYLLHGRLLRPAQVMVAAAPSGDETGGSEN